MNSISDGRMFMSLVDACKETGLSVIYLRKGCRDGSVPHIMAGRKYLVNVVALREMLDAQSRSGKGARC